MYTALEPTARATQAASSPTRTSALVNNFLSLGGPCSTRSLAVQTSHLNVSTSGETSLVRIEFRSKTKTCIVLSQLSQPGIYIGYLRSSASNVKGGFWHGGMLVSVTVMSFRRERDLFNLAVTEFLSLTRTVYMLREWWPVIQLQRGSRECPCKCQIIILERRFCTT